METEAADGTASGQDGTRGGVRAIDSLGEITLEGLRETFPQWRIFSTGATWWATRGGLQHWDGPRSLLLRVIAAPDLTALAERLCLQEWLDGLDGEALAAVYRGTLMGNPR